MSDSVGPCPSCQHLIPVGYPLIYCPHCRKPLPEEMRAPRPLPISAPDPPHRGIWRRIVAVLLAVVTWMLACVGVVMLTRASVEAGLIALAGFGAIATRLAQASMYHHELMARLKHRTL